MGFTQRIYGPPGTGKTSYIRDDIESKLVADPYSAGAILAASFSVTAARNLISRAVFDTEITIDDEEQVRTLHSLGYRQVKELRGDANVLDIANDLDRFMSSKGNKELQQQWNDEQAKSGYTIDWNGGVDVSRLPLGNQCMDEYTLARNSCKDLRIVSDATRGFVQRWEAFKALHNVIDFADMIAIPVANHLPIPRASKYVYIDEAQDMTPLQVTWVNQWREMLGDDDEIILALDDDQSIYGFMGCDPAWILDMDGPDMVDDYVLDQSWRMPSTIHGLSQRLISRVKRRKAKAFYPRAGGCGEVRSRPEYMLDARMYGNKAGAMMDEIANLAAAGRSVMILAHTNLMLSMLVAMMRDRLLPFSNKYRPAETAWNPVTKQTKELLTAYCDVEARDGQITYGLLRTILRKIKVSGVTKVPYTKLEPELMKPPSATLVPADRLGWWLTDTARMSIASGNPDWLAEHLSAATLGKRDSWYPLDVVKQRGIKALDWSITVGTIHSAKGGEADAVYLFPDISRLAWEAGNADALHRLFYVGVTRARESLTLCGASGKNYFYPFAKLLQDG